MAFRAHFLHRDLPTRVAGTLLGHCREQRPGQALREVVGHVHALQTAHVARRTGGHGHVGRRQILGWSVKAHVGPACAVQNPVLGLVEDLDLGVVGAHMALAAGLRLPGQRHGGRVPRVTLGTATDGAVGLGLADGMTAHATGLVDAAPLGQRQCIGRPIDGSRVHALGCGDLLVGETLGAHHRRPRRRGMAAAHELLVLSAVTVATVGGRQ